MEQSNLSIYVCDRCKCNGAFRLSIRIHQPELKYKTEEIDLCPACAVYGFGLLAKRLPEEVRDGWLNQFKSGMV